jgi:hypothetical protein
MRWVLLKGVPEQPQLALWFTRVAQAERAYYVPPTSTQRLWGGRP